MRKLGIILSACVLAFGCTDYKSQVEKLTLEKEALAYETHFKDSAINSFVQSFNEIEENLREVELKQNVIVKSTADGELKKQSKERINASIAAINVLMEENRTKIAELSKQLKNSKVKVARFDKMVASLNEQLEQKNAELAQLNAELANLNTTVATLNTTVDTLKMDVAAKSTVIETQTTALNKAYYTTGTSKELETKQVISKEGGFLGLGKAKQLKQDFNPNVFTTIDKTQTSTIELVGKDAKLVTNHPTGSYKIERNEKEEVKDIVITDPEKFWSASKYLVVMVDK
jgi:predicted RNase H-like nuclease (RuvC/YqgF family)